MWMAGCGMLTTPWGPSVIESRLFAVSLTISPNPSVTMAR